MSFCQWRNFGEGQRPRLGISIKFTMYLGPYLKHFGTRLHYSGYLNDCFCLERFFEDSDGFE